MEPLMFFSSVSSGASKVFKKEREGGQFVTNELHSVPWRVLLLLIGAFTVIGSISSIGRILKLVALYPSESIGPISCDAC
jgi:Na+/H+ antiporter NhaD/arsenite permease-like protein